MKVEITAEVQVVVTVMIHVEIDTKSCIKATNEEGDPQGHQNPLKVKALL